MLLRAHLSLIYKVDFCCFDYSIFSCLQSFFDLYRIFYDIFSNRVPFKAMLNANDGESGDYSYLDIAEIIRTKGVNVTEDLKELWSRILFSVLISNTDDHLRNHGFLKLEPNGWSLSPLYDVNPSTDRTSNLQLNINETSSTTSVDLALSVAKYFGLGS